MNNLLFSLFLFSLVVISSNACSFSAVQTLQNSWTEADGTARAQYDLTITNTGPETISILDLLLSMKVSSYWSSTANADSTYGLPSWLTSGLPVGQSWAWGFISYGATTISIGASAPGNCAMSYTISGGTPVTAATVTAAASSGSSSGSSSSSGGGGSATPTGCTGNPPTYNGLPCATTTRYFDGTTGACGCGVGDNGPYPWQRYSFTAAGSQGLFGAAGVTWCGSGCGSCYEITPTGDCPTGSPCATKVTPIVVMVTNLCPYQYNMEWCPNPGQTNQHGYGAHFDLLDSAQLYSNLGWNNPVVTYRQVSCGSLGSPTCSDSIQCQCSTTQCSSGGVVSYNHIDGNATTIEVPNIPVIQPTKHSEKVNKSWILLGVAGGFAAITAVVSVVAFYAARKKFAPLKPRMQPLLDEEFSSQL